MYVIVWEFFVSPEHVPNFVAAYKSDGAWAQLFARADGYLGTELLSATGTDHASTFITIDRWKTAEDFTRFQERFGTEYRELDTQLEGVTVSERKLGTFLRED
jgi:heme-degrading monooxygenase HmoA